MVGEFGADDDFAQAQDIAVKAIRKAALQPVGLAVPVDDLFEGGGGGIAAAGLSVARAKAASRRRYFMRLRLGGVAAFANPAAGYRERGPTIGNGHCRSSALALNDRPIPLLFGE